MTNLNLSTFRCLAFAVTMSLTSCVSLIAQEAANESLPVAADEPGNDLSALQGDPAGSLTPDKPETKDKSIEAGGPLVSNPDEQFREESETSEEWTTSKLIELLNGETDPPKGWPKKPTQIRFRRDAVGRDGKPVASYAYFEAHGQDLEPYQRHAICVMQFDGLVHELRRKLDQTLESDEEEKTLDELANALSARFKIDTVFQDIKVKEIEKRAQKLRDELTAREEAEKFWVKAMMTLAEMRADGIDTMQSGAIGPPLFTMPTPTARAGQAYAFGSRQMPSSDLRRNPATNGGGQPAAGNQNKNDGRGYQSSSQHENAAGRLSRPANPGRAVFDGVPDTTPRRGNEFLKK